MLNNIRVRHILFATFILIGGFFSHAFAQGETESVSSFRKVYDFKLPTVNSTGDISHIVLPDSNEVVSGEYVVGYFCPPMLQSLLDLHIRGNNKEETAAGYRVQIYAGSRLEFANEAKADFLQSFGDFDISIYQKWQPPHFRVRVGDFLSRSEAMREMAAFRQVFPDAFIVKDIINLPKYKKQAVIPDGNDSDGLGGREIREN